MVFTVAFCEAVVGVGLFVSGAILVAVCSILYLEGITTLSSMILLAFLGATLGDHFGFYLGRRIGPGFYETEFSRKYQNKLNRPKELLVKYGVLAIFLGRFLTPIRSVMPLLSGVSGMCRLRYSMYDLIACLLWALALGAIVIGICLLYTSPSPRD